MTSIPITQVIRPAQQVPVITSREKLHRDIEALQAKLERMKGGSK